uniref:THO complex subunit 7 homolog n=1 Tax=Aureoumbra lagunensis TaxID=44058 RepID=A0A7S3NL04_9STRA|mmetsp:Transcript_16836/g.25337  ORF Transcript_16836/g.25337 Transcript_16836/m.25337 type:complete len:353 (-) Transcript_16836:86-1144(-)
MSENAGIEEDEDERLKKIRAANIPEDGVKFPLEEEIEIQKERLITRETVFLSRSAKKALQKYGSIYSEGDNNKAGALCELKLFALDVQRCGNQAIAYEFERDKSQMDKMRMKKQIEKTNEEIIQLQKLLAKNRIIRQRKEEYEALAKIVNDKPTQADTLLAIDAVSADTVSIDTKLATIESFLRTKSTHYDLLLQTIDDLTQIDKDENTFTLQLLSESSSTDDFLHEQTPLLTTGTSNGNTPSLLVVDSDEINGNNYNDDDDDDDRPVFLNRGTSSPGTLDDDPENIPPKKRRGIKHSRSDDDEDQPPPRTKQRTLQDHSSSVPTLGGGGGKDQEEAGEILEGAEDKEDGKG